MTGAFSRTKYDAVIVGSGPNGLAAAIVLAQQGLSTLVIEGGETPGGGMRSSALTLPGFTHDVCSAVHPLGLASPFFRTLPLDRFGLTWIDSPTPLTHVLGHGHATALERSIDATAAQFGRDGDAYRGLVEPFVAHFDRMIEMILGPLRFPSSPFLMARFGLHAIRSMYGLARSRFDGDAPRALLSGIAAHAMIPLDRLVTSSFALVLAIAGHAVGWPIARGGSQSIADALVGYYKSLGGELRLGMPISRWEQLPSARAYLLDTGARQLGELAGTRLSERYRRRLSRFRYGPGVFKVDWAINGPIPWKDERCQRAVTVHLAGTIDSIAASEAAVHQGRLSEKPFVLLGQPSIVDPTRAPAGQGTIWAYCHVPHGSSIDALSHIENEIESHAPGFRDRILARATRNAVEMEAYNPNYLGGDINGGLSDLMQLFFRPMARIDPYATSAPDIFLCSSSTPPGGGVHGMCGFWAARSALRRVFSKRI